VTTLAVLIFLWPLATALTVALFRTYRRSNAYYLVCRELSRER